LRAYELSGLGWTPELAASIEPGLQPGRVAIQHRGGEYVVYTELGELRARLPGKLLHEGSAAAVGDWVALDGETIRAVLPRRTAIVRNAAGRETTAQVLAANVDIAFVLTSLGPDLEPRRLERYLTATWESGARPVILLTKADLHEDAAEQALEVESIAVGAPVHVVSAVTGEGCDEVAAYLTPGTTAVLLGSSGVGKSTLVNRLVGHELLRTQPIREDDGKGRHTTTHRELVVLPGGGLLIDTPGIRELQLWDGGERGLEESFADVDELAPACRFGDCTHTLEPGCAVLAAVDDGVLALDRLRSYRKQQRELRWQAMRQGDRGERDARRKEIREFARSAHKNSW
jgi:ribosome biogenesis GTPase / thiamine phosphate phosphatase